MDSELPRLDSGKEKFSAEEYERYFEMKVAGLERLLGPIWPSVDHAIVPYAVGGPVDMYYFQQATDGTAFVTMELIEPDGTGPLPSDIGTFELIAFTRHKIGDASSEAAFRTISLRVRKIFTTVGRYSTEAVLNPKDTCEVPDNDAPSHFLVFDEYAGQESPFLIGDKKHGLLLCIEVFPQEMDFAMQHGSQLLLDRLRSQGVYPYSDLDRKPVV